jgi:hypothetical protein
MAVQDPWVPLSNAATGIGNRPLPLGTQTLRDVVPLDAQLGVDDPVNVPPMLRDALFGQPDVDTTLRTFAILDAAKVTNLPDMLATSGLQHACLFQGDAYETMNTVAPWIVELDETNSFIRKLFTQIPDKNVPWFLWDKSPGIYVRSAANLKDMVRHFRKFTRIKDADDQWFYFRFYEPDICAAFCQAVADDPARRVAWFNLAHPQPIHSFVICGSTTTVLTAPVPETSPRISNAPFRITHADRQIFSQIRIDRFDTAAHRTFTDGAPNFAAATEAEKKTW